MIGDWNHAWPAFEQRLLAHGITVLIDVRSRPRALRRVQSGP
jgi:hypothetical protein